MKVIICGSAASWMIDKIINNRGGLHNRVTQTIRLLPFTLNETQQYLRSKNVILDQFSQLQLYMAMGGIPHYLKSINPGESTAQVIDRLCFAKDGLLKNEFKNRLLISVDLYKASLNLQLSPRTDRSVE